MTAVYPLQNSFSGGQISPRLQARVDTPMYQRGVDVSRNFYPTPQGSAFRRAGTEFMWPTYENGPVRLIQFERGVNQDYVVEFGDSYIRLFNRDGIVQKLGGELLLNPEFTLDTDGLRYWNLTGNFTSEIPSGGDTIEVESLIYDTINLGLKTTVLQYATSANFLEISQEVAAIEDPSTPGTYVSHTLDMGFVFDGGLNATRVNVQIGDGTDPIVYGNLNFTESGFFPEVFTPLGPTVSVVFRVELPGPIGSAYPAVATIQQLSLRPTTADPLILTTGGPLNTSVPWTVDDISQIDVAMDLGGGTTAPDRLWITHPNYPPHVLIRVSENDWKCIDLIAGPDPIFVSPPTEWTANNYPSTVELYSGRSWFSGVPSSRAQIWASKAGDYFAFTPGSGAGDPLDLLLVTRGTIQWLKGQKALLIGTDLGEHTISSSTGYRALAAADIDVREQSSHGSSAVEPLIVGSEVLYISLDRTKLYATDYLRENDGWISQDLAWGAENITKDSNSSNLLNGIAFSTWARDPNNQIINTMADGTLTICVYDKQMQVLAWSSQDTQHKDSQGTVFVDNYISLCVTNQKGGDSPWYCVKRGDKYYIETTQAGEIGNQYTDSWVQRATVGESNTVSGLDHLEGYTVQVLVDSGGGFSVEPDKVVVDGSISTEQSGNAVVGLEYTAYMKTLRREGGNQAGSSQSSQMAFADVVLRLNNSAVPQVNGWRPALRMPSTPQNTPTPLMTGDSTTYHTGMETKGVLEIVQELPLRTEIVAIYGTLRSNVI